MRRLLPLAALTTLIAGLSITSTALAGGFTFQKGDIVAGAGNGTYNVFDPNGNLLTTLNTTSGAPEDTGGIFDSKGNLYVSNFASQSVSVFDINGNLTNATFGSGYNADPESVTLDKSGNVYVGQADGNANILKFDSAGNLLASYAPTRENRGTDWIDLAADQHTIYYTSEGHKVMRFDTATNTQLADFATGLPGSDAYALRILANGDVLVADTSQVVLLDTNGNIIQSYFAPGSSLLFALNILPNGTSFITADIFNNTIYQFNIATGVLEQSFKNPALVDTAGLIVFGEVTQGGGGGGEVPEPTTMALLGTGLSALLLKRRKKN